MSIMTAHRLTRMTAWLNFPIVACYVAKVMWQGLHIAYAIYARLESLNSSELVCRVTTSPKSVWALAS